MTSSILKLSRYHYFKRLCKPTRKKHFFNDSQIYLDQLKNTRYHL